MRVIIVLETYLDTVTRLYSRGAFAHYVEGQE